MTLGVVSVKSEPVRKLLRWFSRIDLSSHFVITGVSMLSFLLLGRR